MKILLTAVLLFFSGLFVSHTSPVKVAVKPAITPTPTINCQQVNTQVRSTGRKYTVDEYLACGITPTPTGVTVDEYLSATPTQTPDYAYPTNMPEPAYQYPTPTDIPTPTIQQNYSCFQNGDMMNCSNGSTITNYGYQAHGTDGTNYNPIGSQIFTHNAETGTNGNCRMIGQIMNCNNN